jgi:hypothetical protein
MYVNVIKNVNTNVRIDESVQNDLGELKLLSRGVLVNGSKNWGLKTTRSTKSRDSLFCSFTVNQNNLQECHRPLM